MTEHFLWVVTILIKPTTQIRINTPWFSRKYLCQNNLTVTRSQIGHSVLSYEHWADTGREFDPGIPELLESEGSICILSSVRRHPWSFCKRKALKKFISKNLYESTSFLCTMILRIFLQIFYCFFFKKFWAFLFKNYLIILYVPPSLKNYLKADMRFLSRKSGRLSKSFLLIFGLFNYKNSS